MKKLNNKKLNSFLQYLIDNKQDITEIYYKIKHYDDKKYIGKHESGSRVITIHIDHTLER